jgi:hypothetical protein
LEGQRKPTEYDSMFTRGSQGWLAWSSSSLFIKK